MKILDVAIRNFRCFGQFDLQVGGDSLFLIGENGTGKTTLLEAIARATGRDRRFSRADFGDIERPILIEIRFGDLSTKQRGLFADEIDFRQPISLTIGMRAVWDSDQEVVDVVHGFPNRGWKRSNREQREGLSLEWLPEARDVRGMLQLGRRKNLIGQLVNGLAIDQLVSEATQGIGNVRQALSQAPPLQALLAEARENLAKLLPGIEENVFSLGVADATTDTLLGDLELLLSHYSDPVSLPRQSSGLAQLSVFTFAMQLVRQQQDMVLLIDEPERSLHPHAQRALIRSLRRLPCQTLITTHSSNLLDRGDPRTIARLFRADENSITAVGPRVLSESQARQFARFATPQTTEAFFAQAVILVEGASDKLAVEIAAEKMGRDLDGEGVTIVSLEGGGGIAAFLGMLGPNGLNLKLAGFCDSDAEVDWSRKLQEAGIIKEGAGRMSLEEVGFFVCETDLEDELLRAVGPSEALKIIEEQGDEAAFRRLASQPQHRNNSSVSQIHTFLAMRGRKVAYAPILVDRLQVERMPKPLMGVLSYV